MQLQKPIQQIFEQLTTAMQQLTDSQYTAGSKTLSNASIGQHVRHIIEMFTCLQDGYTTGLVNYEHRKRDLLIETNRSAAILLLHQVYETLNKPDKPLVLQGAYNESTDEMIQLDTNYYREIAYNLEHCIHHMALIKIGLREMSTVVIPDNFGVASSTIKYRATCAQ